MHREKPLSKPISIDCFLELDNAAASECLSSLEESLNSLLLSAANAKKLQRLSVEVRVVAPSDLDPRIENLVRRKFSDYPGVTSRLQKANGGYFESKNAATEGAPGSYISFTDSDCTYESDYFVKLAQTIQENPEAVVYGITFGRSPRTRFQRFSQYCWQFPPSTIGYGESFPQSQWANNLAVPQSLLERLPFPTIVLQNIRHFETKQERYLWHLEAETLGIRVVQGTMVCRHEQIPSLGAWFVRHWEHGKARGLRVKSRCLGARINLRLASLTGFTKRAKHLQALSKAGKLPSRHLAPAIMLLALGSTLKIMGFLRVILHNPDWVVTQPDRRNSGPLDKIGSAR